MAYIGKEPIVGNFQKCDALTASATADYTLQVGSSNVSPESVNHMIVSLNGVIQSPTTAYTVSGATLSFASALTSSDTIDFVILLGNVLDIGTPSDDTVATAKIQDDAVTAAKINTDLISGTTALAVAPADTDEFLVSDAGTLKRIDYSLIKSQSGLTLLNSVSSSVDVSEVDIDSTHINSTYDNYLIKFNAIPATGAVDFYSRFFVGGTIQTGSNYTYELYHLGNNSGQAGSSADSGILFNTIDTIGNSSTDTIQVIMELGNVNSTTYQTSLFFQSHLMNNDGTAVPYSFTGVGHYLTNSSVVNGIRFYFSSGNISDYEYKIYGITKS